MEAPILSIIIPTHKRPEILRQCLSHIEKQTVAGQIEVIVVSDGEKLRLEIGDSRLNLRCFDIPKSHQGVARNKGVKEARGKYVMFIGDDIFLTPDACEKHLNVHYKLQATSYKLAVLGFTTWDPAFKINDVMRWLEQSGWQFGYPMIAPYSHRTVPPSIQHRFTYTSHISLTKETALKLPFREDVTLYGWEDIEWGWRLKEAGVKLFYEPDAKALHHHHMTMEDSLKRMETLGKSAVAMAKIRPELKLIPRGLKKLKYEIASMLPTMRGRHAKSFLNGLHLRKEAL